MDKRGASRGAFAFPSAAARSRAARDSAACWRAAALKKIDSLDLVESRTQAAYAAAPRIAPACRPGSFHPRGRQHLVCVPFDGAVVGVACLPKNRHNILASISVQRVRRKHRRFAPERDNFGANPFEILATLVGIRQDVD